MKYFVGGFAIAFVLVLGIVILRHETREIRQAVKESAKEVAKESVDRAVDRAPEAIEKTAGRVIGDLMSPSRMPTQPSRPGPAPAAGRDPAPAPADSEGKGDIRPGPDSQSKSDPATKTGSRVKVEPPVNLDPVGMIGTVFETGRKITRAADDVGQQVFAIDDAQEREIGAEVHNLVLQKHKCLRRPELLSRIEALAAPLIANCHRTNMKYTFTFIEEPSVNAFSHAGGYIYLHTGLLKVAKEDVDLQFVLGHEIGHVDLKHCTRALAYSANITKWTHAAVGQISQAAYHMIALGYNEDLEFEADEYAFRDMLQIGRTRDEALSFPRKFAKYLVENGFERGRRKPASAADATVQEIQNHFRSHPPAVERVKRLESIKL